MPCCCRGRRRSHRHDGAPPEAARSASRRCAGRAPASLTQPHSPSRKRREVAAGGFERRGRLGLLNAVERPGNAEPVAHDLARERQREHRPSQDANVTLASTTRWRRRSQQRSWIRRYPSPHTRSVSEQIARIEERLAATNTRDWDAGQALHTPDAVRTAPELEQRRFSWCNSGWRRPESSMIVELERARSSRRRRSAHRIHRRCSAAVSLATPLLRSRQRAARRTLTRALPCIDATLKSMLQNGGCRPSAAPPQLLTNPRR
jgi:hypothetical protein